MDNIKFLVVFLFINYIPAYGQNPDYIALKQYRPVMHEDGSLDSLALDEYKGKLILLDFWNRSCASCIRQMPKLHALNQKYADQIEIIPVTKDSYEQVKKVYARQRGGPYDIKLSTVYSDTALAQKFAVKGYPTAVWLNANGQFLASTYGTAVNEEVIALVLSEDYSLLDRSATVKGEVMQNKLKNKVRARKGPLLKVSVLPYNLTNSINESNGLEDTTLCTSEYKNRTVIDLIKLLLYSTDDPFTVLLFKDNRNKRITFSDSFKKEFPSLFTRADNLTYEEKVYTYENTRRTIQMVYDKKVDPVEMRNAALNMFELAIGHKVSRVFEESDVWVLKYSTPEKHEMGGIPLESQVSLRTIADLVSFLGNISEHVIVADTESLYSVEIGVTLDKTKEVNALIQELEKLGVVLVPEKRRIERLHVR
ncbi:MULTISPECIES: TlpA family protein disulfide reductase [Sphingobacterium]|uniref:TlpA family protein disulfide reductase n=1 Tax=Sphingobacterium TaxID=28453 RepID=UPI0013DA0635|nr:MULTISPECIES: TlpA disulfide reductase family protein [unclassified Sphingobacterium]